MFSEPILSEYLLLVLMLVLLGAVAVLRYKIVSILWPVRATKTNHRNGVGNAGRNASTGNDAGEASAQPDRQTT
jgi:hypothetical protein